MYLSSLEIQGFKTFAKKTTIRFPEPGTEHRPVAVIVGPNGSGKSNLADAIRWCLGEQSLKHLRGKKSEDVIFSGSVGVGRSSFAEVAMTFAREAHDEGEVSEMSLARRLYRDGESDYLLNGKSCRLQDVQLFLAEQGIGQRSYTVIGQGMVDHILTSSPEERKVFFDDATGVRSLQLKRHQAFLKLKRSSEHLADVMRLLGEIEPRVKLLKRQMDRLAEKEAVEKELHIVQMAYFGQEWWNLQSSTAGLKQKRAKESASQAELKIAIQVGDKELEKLQAALTASSATQRAEWQRQQIQYKAAQAEVTLAERAVFEAERAIEMAKVRFQTSWAPLPLQEIISELSALTETQNSITSLLKAGGDISTLSAPIDSLFTNILNLKKKLTKPQSEDFTPSAELTDALAGAQERAKEKKEAVVKLEATIAAPADKNEPSEDFILLQRELRQKQQVLHDSESRVHGIELELTREETRLESLERELNETAPELAATIKARQPEGATENADVLRDRMHRLMNKRDMIGGIDLQVEDEYKAVAEKFTFLNAQSTDLEQAIESSRKLVKELDGRIEKQSEQVFKDIAKAFDRYFKVLFGGGSCALLQLTDSPHEKVQEAENNVSLNRALEALADEEIHEMDLGVSDTGHITGIDIQATPPGKKLKSLNLLSGGEKALTSIALLCAIMAVNPSPFVLLDEVDAALDEANTMRFANILGELRKHSQFIVITHNRATMEQADVLYGVTMGEEGVSSLLSVKLTDITADGTAGTARR